MQLSNGVTQHDGELTRSSASIEASNLTISRRYGRPLHGRNPIERAAASARTAPRLNRDLTISINDPHQVLDFIFHRMAINL